jgi:hypothetical protein
VIAPTVAEKVPALQGEQPIPSALCDG